MERGRDRHPRRSPRPAGRQRSGSPPGPRSARHTVITATMPATVVPCQRSPGIQLHVEPLGGRRRHRVRGDLRRLLEVVVAQRGDPARVLISFVEDCSARRRSKTRRRQGRAEDQAERRPLPKLACGRHRPERRGRRSHRRDKPPARPVDSATRGARAWSTKCSVVTKSPRRARVALVGAACGAVDRGFTSSLFSGGGGGYSGRWQTASRLLPSMSKMNVR